MGKIYQALEKSNIKHPEKKSGPEKHPAAEQAMTVEKKGRVEPENTLKGNATVQQTVQQDVSVKKKVSAKQDVPVKKKTLVRQKIPPQQTVLDFDIPANIDASLVTVHTPHSIESEQFRLLKNNILFPEKGFPPRNIMVTSASPGEGKTFVATNLAASIARSIDEYVLLIDCDLRAPYVGKVFGLNDPPGLSEYLTRALPLSSLLVKTFLEKLTILPSGAIPPNPSELLSSEQMRRLLAEVKTRYNDRYVIVDTPPPYLTSETNALARHVDGIILVVRQGKTRKKEIENIIDIYGKEKIIGVVQNFARKKPGYGYGYHKYGYGYGK